MTTTARLRAFVAVAETGSVRAAAQRLVVTESAVSAAITALTKEVGVPLIEREGRGLRLTPSGLTFASYARTILGLHEQALTATRGDVDPEHGRVRVAAVTTAGEHVLPATLVRFRRRYPGIDLRLEVGTSERVWRLLASYDTDLVIAGRPPTDLEGLVVHAVRPNELLAVAAPELADNLDLARVTWLLREVGSSTRTTCEALLAGLELDPPRVTLGSNGAVVAGAVAGLGLTLLSHDAVTRQLADGELVEVPVPGTPLRRHWHAVTHRQSSVSTGLFIEELTSDEDPAVGWRRTGGTAGRPGAPSCSGPSLSRDHDRDREAFRGK